MNGSISEEESMRKAAELIRQRSTQLPFLVRKY
jgi:hypothetical protein